MITIVSGFQRCGSSLMCQMLQAGGMTVFHDAEMGYPAFETHLNLHSPDDSWLNHLDGQALKWLEPQHAMPPPVDHELRILWMRRDFREQGKSAAKFLRAVGKFTLPHGTAERFAVSYRQDEPKAVSAWKKRARVEVVSFEAVLAASERTAERIQTFLGVLLDTKAMAAQVRPRMPQCFDGFLEMQLMATK